MEPPRKEDGSSTGPNVGSRVEPDVIFTDDSDSESENQFESEGVEPVDIQDLDHGWTPYFRYDSVYQDQVDAINQFVELLYDNGYYLLEGACGTGKTLAAITGGIHAIRDRKILSEQFMDDEDDEFFPQYSRVLAVTPVKQQLKQFIDEMRGINDSLPESKDPVNTVVMRGRSDMMPYGYTNVSPFDTISISEKADSLRETARKVIRFDSNIPIDWPDGFSPPDFSRYDYDWEDPSDRAQRYKDRYIHDPFRAQAVQEIVAGLTDDSKFDQLVVDGVETPYPDYVPHTNDVVDMNERKSQGKGNLPMNLQGKFDPFYVGFFANRGNLPFGFDEAHNNVFDQQQLFESAARRGICPHESMSELAGDADVVLGNYNHLFDPQTRLLTNDKIGLLDDETIVVVDEAHQVERKVRDMLSAELDLYNLNRAINDVKIARDCAKGSFSDTPLSDKSGGEKRQAQQTVQSAIKAVPNMSVTLDDLVDAIQLMRFAKQKLGEYGAEKLNEEYGSGGWQQQLERYGANVQEKKLAEPDQSDTDQFTKDALSRSFKEHHFTKVYQVMMAVDLAYDHLESDGIYSRETQAEDVGDFFYRWATEDDIEYYRHVVLKDSEKDSIPDSFPKWVHGWTPKFQLFNCVPRDELRAIFSDLGGGVLMSATIQPADVYKEAVGIDDIPYPEEDDPEQDDDSDGGDSSGGLMPSSGVDMDTDVFRPTDFDQYPLRFPTDNRLSLSVDLDKYIYKNRGRPVDDLRDMSNTRIQYLNVIKTGIQTEGNVMIAMPNYGEAKWAYEYFQSRDDVSKELHLDQSSSDRETTDTLESFFSGGDSVIFTSARSTITEGVDYDGHKLHCCIAVGIPLIPTNTPRTQAIKAAYDQRMDGSGFETALTIPAVRKVRQSFGRVIRGDDECGVRMLLDSRYSSDSWDGVKEYLSEQEQEEFNHTEPDDVGQRLSDFWSRVDYTPQQPADITVGDQSKSDVGTVDVGSDVGIDESESVDSSTSDSEMSDDDSKNGTSKIYFGNGSNLSGWTALDRATIKDEIIPLVNEYSVEDPESSDVETINLNFTSELSMGGWIDVEASVVRDEIEPIVQRCRR